MQDFPRFSTAFAKGSIGALIGAGGLFGLVHLVLRIPIDQLVGPWLLYAGLGILMTPFFYWSKKHYVSSGGDWKPLFLTGVGFSMMACPLLFYYASKFGLLSSSDLPGLYATVLVAGPPIFLAAYWVGDRLKLLGGRRRHAGAAQQGDAE
jgi:hypothetical protein